MSRARFPRVCAPGWVRLGRTPPGPVGRHVAVVSRQLGLSAWVTAWPDSATTDLLLEYRLPPQAQAFADWFDRAAKTGGPAQFETAGDLTVFLPIASLGADLRASEGHAVLSAPPARLLADQDERWCRVLAMVTLGRGRP